MDAYYQVKRRLQAPTLACKFDISHWLPCGADGWADVQSRDYQNFSDFFGMGLRSCAQRGGALPSYTHHNKYLSLETNTIVLPFDHRVCFFTENPQEVKRSAIFTQE